MAVADRVKRMWNAFRFAEQQETQPVPYSYGVSTSVRADRPRTSYSSEKSIISSIYTRIAIDVAAIEMRHVLVDEEGRYSSDADSRLNYCLMIEPNLDQGPRAYRQDIVHTMFENGAAAIVPVDTIQDPTKNLIFDIESLRVGYVTKWHPRHVQVSVYNVDRGERQEITLEKRFVAIAENPLYPVMNEPNSTLQRLIRKLNLLDFVDEQSGSGKLDLIIQLPYTIKSEARKTQAEQRRKDIEFQLKGSQYGIAYTDGTEKITQLNRPAENNLLKQIEFLTEMLYGQLGLTPAVLNGTADEATMINYYNRTVQPIVTAIVEAKQRTFLGHTGVKSQERIKFFRNPFALVPLSQMAEIADKFVRNEVLTPNEMRDYLGLVPSKDKKADELRNPNMPLPEPVEPSAPPSTESNDFGKETSK